MISDKKFMSYLKFQSIILLVSIILGLFIVNAINSSYEKEILTMKKQIAVNILNEDMNDITDILIESKNNEVEIEKILEENHLYRLSEYKGFVNLNKLKKMNITYVLLFLVAINLAYIILSLNRYFGEKKRLKEINIYLNKILSNDYTLDIQEYTDDSLAALKNDIYKITNKLRFMSEYSLNEKRNLEETLSDISHQLKTPLTSMFVINTILEDEHSEEVKLDFLKKNRQQLEKVEWLVKSLLKMSQIDSGTIQFTKEKVSVQSLIDKSISDHLILIELKHIDLVLGNFEGLFVNCDLSWTSEAISNIIKNAIEHTPEYGKIEIMAKSGSFNTIISIKDSGEGIAEEDVENIFKRFYKKDKKSEGIGIGMNLSKTIMIRQNSDIKVESKLNEGTTFKIIIN